MDALPLLERLALRRRRQGASGLWSAVAFAAFLLRQYRRRARNDQVSLREVLQPGETLTITHTTQPRG
jgi:hypothetical protein